MPSMRTDDAPRMLRAVWLGPKGASLPVVWTYVQWAVTLGAMPLTSTVLVLALWLVGAPPWILVVAWLVGQVLGVYYAVKLMKRVTFDEPLKHKKATLQSEFSRRRRRPEQDVTVVWPSIVVSDLTDAASSLLPPVKELR